jgi:hypothetical protein
MSQPSAPSFTRSMPSGATSFNRGSSVQPFSSQPTFNRSSVPYSSPGGYARMNNPGTRTVMSNPNAYNGANNAAAFNRLSQGGGQNRFAGTPVQNGNRFGPSTLNQTRPLGATAPSPGMDRARFGGTPLAQGRSVTSLGDATAARNGWTNNQGLRSTGNPAAIQSLRNGNGAPALRSPDSALQRSAALSDRRLSAGANTGVRQGGVVSGPSNRLAAPGGATAGLATHTGGVSTSASLGPRAGFHTWGGSNSGYYHDHYHHHHGYGYGYGYPYLSFGFGFGYGYPGWGLGFGYGYPYWGGGYGGWPYVGVGLFGYGGGCCDYGYGAPYYGGYGGGGYYGGAPVYEGPTYVNNEPAPVVIVPPVAEAPAVVAPVAPAEPVAPAPTEQGFPPPAPEAAKPADPKVDEAAKAARAEEFRNGLQAFQAAKYADSLAVFDKLVASDPKDGEAWMGVAHSAFALGDYRRSAQGVIESAALGGFPRGYKFDPAPLYGPPGTFQKLFDRTLTHIGSTPKDLPAQLVVAWLYTSMGQKDDAQAAINRVLALNPGDKTAKALSDALLPALTSTETPPAPPAAPAPEASPLPAK